MLGIGVMAQNDSQVQIVGFGVAPCQGDREVTVVGFGMQTKVGDIPVLAKGQSWPVHRPKITKDKKSKLTTTAWEDMEMGYITDKCEVEAPVVENLPELFPKLNNLPKEYMLRYWMLTNEGESTVLHCYFTMPADEVTNLWLACEETAIVDLATGKQYRAQRTAPDCFRKHFSVKAPAGTPLDFKIYFPKLPETTRDINIYGVPLWEMRGKQVRITQPQTGIIKEKDDVPQIKTPTLVKAADNYNKDDHKTWAEYENPHLIKPISDGTMALWNTPEATYIAVAHEQNWMREYYGIQSGTMLIDNLGHRYKLKEVRGLPLDQQFWINAYSGDFIVFLMVFEPLRPNIFSFVYTEPEGEEFEMWGADNRGKTTPCLNVEQLRANQILFEPIERQIEK